MKPLTPKFATADIEEAFDYIINGVTMVFDAGDPRLEGVIVALESILSADGPSAKDLLAAAYEELGSH